MEYTESMEPIIINKTNFETLLYCMNEIRADLDLRPISSYKVKPSYTVWVDPTGVSQEKKKVSFTIEDLNKAESSLNLNKELLSEFACGDVDVKMEMIEKNPELQIADDFLNAVFNNYF